MQDYNSEYAVCQAAILFLNSLINNNLSGYYTLGYTYHTALKEWGLHLCATQTVWSRQQRYIELFLMSVLSSRREGKNHIHIAGGATLHSVFSKKGRDCLGLGITSAIMAELANETTIELTYKYQIHNYISIQPNIQLIINPIGTGVRLKNALFTALRMEFAL